MPKKILITYSTKSGSTMRIAEIINEELIRLGAAPMVLEINSVKGLSGYDAVVMGSPIVMGKIRPDIMKFVKENENDLVSMPSALYITCMRLTRDSESPEPGFPVYIDPNLAETSKPSGSMNFMEKNHLLSLYLKQFLNKFPKVIPSATAVFKGGLDFDKLDPLSFIFMKFMAMIDDFTKEGDYVNEVAVKSWVEKFYLDL